MLTQGLLLMVAGMGTVFLFLVIMVLVMMAVGKYYKLHEADYVDVDVPQRPNRQKTGDAGSVVAAIAVALQFK